MCAPVAIGLIGAAVSAVGAMASAQAEAQNAKYNAAVERVNKRARFREGLHESVNIKDEFDRAQGTQTALSSAAGMDPFAGSALDIFDEGQSERYREQTTNVTNYTSAAMQHENRAAQFDMQAKNAQRAGAINAMASFLGGLKGVSGSFGSSLGSSGGGWTQTYG